MPSAKHQQIVAHYESCLARHGDSCRGVDWPNPADAETRYRVMLDVIRERAAAGKSVNLLDFGCGLSHLYEYLLRTERRDILYEGLDASAEFVRICRAKHPEVTFHYCDVLDRARTFRFDYVVMNGAHGKYRLVRGDVEYTAGA
jgi:2-polyprenyl-3-methyl-5-hydroxy-6-metoxy-1,4-benzoquinol methylase